MGPFVFRTIALIGPQTLGTFQYYLRQSTQLTAIVTPMAQSESVSPDCQRCCAHERSRLRL